MNVVFDKKVSKALKGFLVIIMYWSHLFNHPERLQKGIEWVPILNIKGKTIEEWMVPFFHVAVPCFFFIAGYGYFISHLNRNGTVKKQVFKLYEKYWIVFIIFVPLCAFLGKIQITPISLLLNFIGLSSSYCGEWWFLSTYVEILLLFSFAHRYIYKRKIKTQWVFMISILFSFGGYFLNILSAYIGVNMDNLILHEIYFFLIKQPLFVIGWCVAKEDYINKISAFLGTIKSGLRCLIICLLFIFILIFQYVQIIPETYIYILYLPAFVYGAALVYSKLPTILNKFFEALGKYSTYMWLCHSILLYKLVQKYIYFPKVSIICWGNLILISFICSVLLASIEKCVYKMAIR